MGHTLKRGTPPSRCPHINLFQLLVLTGPFYLCSGDIQVTTTVNDKAVLSCDYNISAEKVMYFRVYWQKDNKVVLTVISGKEKVWSEYENRTSIDVTNNLSITILAVRLSDKGTYTCVVQEFTKEYFQRRHLISVTLLVRDDFPVPNITDLGTPSPNIKRIICSTSGGFPEPHLSWLENGKELKANNTTVSQDHETELYTIRSELHFNETTNHTFVCLIKYGGTEVSQIFNWQISKQDHPLSQTWASNLYLMLIVVSAILGIVVIPALIIWKCGFCTRLRERLGNGSLEMENSSPTSTGSAEASG